LLAELDAARERLRLSAGLRESSREETAGQGAAAKA